MYVVKRDEKKEAVKFDKTPEPDYVDVFPNELSYDED